MADKGDGRGPGVWSLSWARASYGFLLYALALFLTALPACGGDVSATSPVVDGGTADVGPAGAGGGGAAGAGGEGVGGTAPEAKAATPSFSLPSGTYTGAQSVQLSTSTPNATIHYTLGDTAPTAASPVYASAIELAAGGAARSTRSRRRRARSTRTP